LAGTQKAGGKSLAKENGFKRAWEREEVRGEGTWKRQ